MGSTQGWSLTVTGIAHLFLQEALPSFSIRSSYCRKCKLKHVHIIVRNTSSSIPNASYYIVRIETK